MTTPLDELKARISTIRDEAAFVNAAASLRPRVNDSINWSADVNAVSVARSFMEAKYDNPDGFYAGLFIRSVAAFERFGRQIIGEFIERKSRSCKKYTDLPEQIRNQNISLTGEVLKNHLNQRDHVEYDVKRLVLNLAACLKDGEPYSLNREVFSNNLTNCKSESWDRVLSAFGLTSWSDSIGSKNEIKKLFETTGTRDTGKALKEKIDSIIAARNQLVHAGNVEPTITYEELVCHLNLIESFCQELFALDPP